MRYPMPSPRGTNFEGLYIPSTWSNPTMAMDAASPRLRPVRDGGVAAPTIRRRRTTIQARRWP